MANESDLRPFPFDYDSVRILIAAEIGTGDRYVRLRWQESNSLEKHDRSASAITPPYVGTQNMEWDLVNGGNSVVRMDERHNVTGHYTAIEVQLRLTRRYGFYLWKIMLLVWMIACMSWSTFLVKGEDGRIDSESFIERLNYTAALLLAAVSFLYISQESIPRLSYLTSLDTMILFSFFNLCEFFCGVGGRARLSFLFDRFISCIFAFCLLLVGFLFVILFCGLQDTRKDSLTRSNQPKTSTKNLPQNSRRHGGDCYC